MIGSKVAPHVLVVLLTCHPPYKEEQNADHTHAQKGASRDIERVRRHKHTGSKQSSQAL